MELGACIVVTEEQGRAVESHRAEARDQGMRTSSMMDRRRGCLPPRRCRGVTDRQAATAQGSRHKNFSKPLVKLPRAAGWRQPRTSQHRQHRGRGGLRAGHGGEAAWKDVGVRARASRPLCHSATLPSPRAPRAVPMEVDEPAPEQDSVLPVSRGPGDKGGALQPEPPFSTCVNTCTTDRGSLHSCLCHRPDAPRGEKNEERPRRQRPRGGVRRGVKSAAASAAAAAKEGSALSQR